MSFPLPSPTVPYPSLDTPYTPTSGFLNHGVVNVFQIPLLPPALPKPLGLPTPPRLPRSILSLASRDASSFLSSFTLRSRSTSRPMCSNIACTFSPDFALHSRKETVAGRGEGMGVTWAAALAPAMVPVVVAMVEGLSVLDAVEPLE